MAARYFAYGSNMSDAVMSARCPGHRFLGPARLPDHRLAFTRRSIRSGTGVADIVAEPGTDVWGALYELDDPSMAELDRKEGSGWAYERAWVTVYRDGDSPEEAVTYRVMEPESSEVQPSPEYLEGLIQSARERELPDEYVESLRRFGLAARHPAE